MSETPSTNYSMIQPHTSGSEQSLSGRPLNVTEPVVAKRICFYKSGDPQFNGVKMVVNGRSFKSFDALLDNLSKRVPLPFGVRNITTPRGIHSVTNLEDLEDGKSYICSQQRKVKPINLEKASKKPLPWQISRPVSGRRRAIQLAREGDGAVFQRGGTVRISTPKKLLVFKNGDVRIRRTIILGKKNTQNFEAFLDHISELMQYPVVKLYTTDGRKVSSLQALILCSGAVVAAGREPFKAGNYDPHRYSLPGKLPGTSNRVYPRINAKPEGRKMSLQIDPSSRSQMFSASSSKGYSNDNNSDSSYVPDSDMGLTENHSHAGEDLFVVPSADDIEKSVHLNQDGSMTVEMRVRFKIKDEETIRWTTTVSRAGLSGDRNDKMGTSVVVEEDQSSELNILTCTDNTEVFNSGEDDVALQQISTDQDSECGMKTRNYDIWQNTDLSQPNNNNNVKPRFYRPPTPGPRRVRQKKAVVESVTLVSDTAVQKQMVGQFSYSEEMDNGEAKSEYCVVTHASTKTSSVTNPKQSELCSNHAMKPSLENQIKEQMLNKVGHKVTTERSLEMADGDGLLQNVFEKSVIKEDLYNSLTTGCRSGVSSAQSSPRKYHLRQVLATESGATERELSSLNSHLEWCESKSEKICNQCKLLHSSQASAHPSPAENNKTEFQRAPIVSGSSSMPAKNGSTESVTKTHFSDESQTTSNSKKKAKKKKKKRKPSSDTMELAVGSQQNLPAVSAEGIARHEGKACEMHVTRENTQHSSTQITIHKRMVEFPVGSSDGSDKILGLQEDLYSQVAMKQEQNELGPDPRQDLNRPLPRIQSRSDIGLSPSAKQEEGLVPVKGSAKTETEQMKEDAHDTTNLSEKMGHGHKAGREKGKTTSDKLHKSSTKQKKTKMNKKTEGALGSKIKTSDEISTLDTFRNADFTDEIVEHSLENYVQRWLQNIFPNVVMPTTHLAPINSKDRKMYHLSVKSFSDKEGHLVEKSEIAGAKLSNSALNHLSDVGVIEESVQELYERHMDCLTDADANIIEEAKYLLQKDIQNGAQLFECNIIHENDKKKIQPGTDNTNSSDDQRCGSETVAEADLKAINNVLGTDVQKDCVSGLLLRQLKSAMFNVENNHSECIEKSCCLTDTCSPSLLGSSSDLLIASLLLLNLKQKLFNMCKDDMVQTTCSCSEIFAQLQYLKQVATKEEAEDLKAAVSNLQECTGNHLVFSGTQAEKQELASCQENASLVEIRNIPDSEKQENPSETLISNDTVSSKEVAKDAEELTEELDCSSEGKEPCSVPVQNSNLNDLDVHSAPQNPNSTDAESNNYELIPNEELSKVNEDSSLQESQDKNTDTSFNNEESGISEDPNSTIYSMTSNDKEHIFDLETSELDDKELDSTENQKCCTELYEKENTNECLILTAEHLTNCDGEDKSEQEDLEEDGTCEESPEPLSPPSPLSFCYESKQIPVDASDEELTSRVKQIVKELECGSHSNSCFDFKKCLKSPATSDLSDYRPETDDSDYNIRPSSDLTNESTEEGLYEEYNKGYVKRTIERLYGKTDASLWPTSKSGPPYMAQKDIEESFHQVMEEAPSLCQACNTWGDEKVPSLASHEIPGDISSDLWEKENATLPAPQFSLNGEEAYYRDECLEEYTNQCCQYRKNIAAEEGVLTDKGKWLLKENHLIRRSPPETSGMYGYADTTSTDTKFDNHSDDIPYSHFGNLDLRPPLKEISSSELEDMAKPCSTQGNYFNMPHNTDSEPFPDDLSTKSKNSQHGSSLHSEAIRKVCTTSTQHCTEVSSPNPTFASVEFRLSDNKVHPLEQPSHNEPIRAQPTSHTNSNRNIQEDQDSLDKLHAICGQHCPILTAIIMSTNEEIRGCAYRKASDVENRVGWHLLTNPAHSTFQDKDIISLDKNQADHCINKIANNIFLRHYADNTLDFVNSHNFGLLVSAALKENQGLKEFHVRENMAADTQEINNPESHAAKEESSQITAIPDNNLSVYQSLRASANQIVEERPSYEDITESCRSGTLYHLETLAKIDWEVAVQLEDENTLNIKEDTLSVKEETLSYVMEDESSSDHSDLQKG